MPKGPNNEMTSLANALSDLHSQMGKNGTATQVENHRASMPKGPNNEMPSLAKA